MKPKMFFIVGIVLLLLTSCGPSPEQIATMTAAAWTATPTLTPTPSPTFTPTPIPYDVNLSVFDASGAPIAGAQIVFAESGNASPILADTEGKFTWANLPGDAATFKVSAQGYLSGEQSATLQRGVNEIVITLERDPYGLLASTACGAGETLFYIEDFQDGQTDLKHYDGGNIPVPLIDAPDETGNTVLVHDFTTPKGDYSSYLSRDANGNFYEFGDAVWRIRFMITKETEWGISWNSAGPTDIGGITTSSSSYGMYFNSARHAGLTRSIWDASGQPVASAGLGFVDKVLIVKPNEWHYLEFSSQQGQLQVWLDGKSAFDITDPTPLPPGGFSIGGGAAGIMYFDAISVCGLSVPFASIAPPVPVTP